MKPASLSNIYEYLLCEYRFCHLGRDLFHHQVYSGVQSRIRVRFNRDNVRREGTLVPILGPETIVGQSGKRKVDDAVMPSKS